MPYIDQKRREELDSAISVLASHLKDSKQRAGDMNYTITKLAFLVYGANSMRYADHNEFIGVLECAKLEFYRVRTGPYEDTKIISNGSVSTSWYTGPFKVIEK